MKIIMTSICLVASCAGLVFLRAATVPVTPQQGSSAHTSVPSKHSKARKRHHVTKHYQASMHTPATTHAHAAVPSRTVRRTWQSGPASSPLETEVIPSRPPAAPPRTGALPGAQAKPKLPAVTNRPAAPGVGSAHVTAGTPAAAIVQATSTNPPQPEISNSPDPEAQRINDEFAGLRKDEAARRAFYNDMLKTVERVRAGTRDDDPAEEKPVSYQSAAPMPRETLPVTPPHLPQFIPPQGPPHASGEASCATIVSGALRQPV